MYLYYFFLLCILCSFNYIKYYFNLIEPQTGTESIPELPSTTPTSAEKPKVVVQQVAQPSVTSEEEPQKTNVANGQQPLQSLKEGNDSSANKFILTPDYIQQTIKNALKQENLNPEIEEKLLQLQRYQEKQMKGGVENSVATNQTHTTTTITTPRLPSRKRPAPSNIPTTTTSTNVQPSTNDKDTEWAETPRKKLAPKQEPRESPK